MMNKGICAAVSIAAAAGLVYLEGATVFAGRFPLGATINGTDVSLKTVAEAENLCSLTDPSTYSLTITGRDNFSAVITGEEIGLNGDTSVDLSDLVSSGKNYSWITDNIKGVNLTTGSSSDLNLDEQALQDKVVELTKGIDNLDTNKAFTAIESAIMSGQTSLSLDDAGCYTSQEVEIADTELSTKDGIDSIESFTVSLNFEGTLETIDFDTIKSWLIEDNGSITVDQTKVADYVQTLVNKYNTTGNTRTLAKTGGGTVSIVPGTYGWALDSESTAASIINAITAQQTATIDPVWSNKGTVLSQTQDWGGDYVEIDLDSQHVYVYRDGVCVFDTDCVSGKASTGHGTPDGAFYIMFCQKDATLKGEGYSTPVSYWMPFYMGVGMHDATWRSAFGGTIYATGGSHGCVNLPLSAAQTIFSKVYAGMPVFVYGGLSQADAASGNYTADSGTADSSDSESSDKDSDDITANFTDEEKKVYDQAVQNYIDVYGMTKEQAKAQVAEDLEEQAAVQADDAASAASSASSADASTAASSTTDSSAASSSASTASSATTTENAGTDASQQAIIEQAVQNYMTVNGMTREQAEAQVQADLAAQAAAAASSQQ